MTFCNLIPFKLFHFVFISIMRVLSFLVPEKKQITDFVLGVENSWIISLFNAEFFYKGPLSEVVYFPGSKFPCF